MTPAERLRAELLRRSETPYEEIFPTRIRVMRNGLARTLEKSIAAAGITYGQWRCLRVLWENDGISQRELAGKLDMTPAAVVFAVDMLERDGMARRGKDLADKRRVKILLTAKGRKLEARLLRESREILIGLFRDVTDEEILTIDRVFGKLTAAIQLELGARSDNAQ